MNLWFDATGGQTRPLIGLISGHEKVDWLWLCFERNFLITGVVIRPDIIVQTDFSKPTADCELSSAEN
jgi:hypothetical protein